MRRAVAFLLLLASPQAALSYMPPEAERNGGLTAEAAAAVDTALLTILGGTILLGLATIAILAWKDRRRGLSDDGRR